MYRTSLVGLSLWLKVGLSSFIAILSGRSLAAAPKCSSILTGPLPRATIFSQTRATDQVLSRIYQLALATDTIPPQSFRSFRDAAIANPLHNLIPVLEMLEYQGQPVAQIAHLERELKLLISNIRAPGLPLQKENIRQSEVLEELPISIQQIRVGQTLHYYRKDHQIEVAGLSLNIPEYLPLRLDSTTRTIRVHEEGEGRELLHKMIEVAQSKKWQNRTAFVLMDLNGLGITNTFRDGHTSGDQYLRQYAEVVQEHLREGLRKEDLFFRYAGDEFIIVMFGITPKQVQRVMQRMSDRVYQSEKVNEVYLREKQTLIEMRESLKDIQDISDLEKLASTHEGLREQMQSLGSTDLLVLKAEVVKFIDYNFSKLAGMRTGISTGIVMMDQGGSLQTYVTEASRQVKKAKSLYYFSSSPESEYNQSKYDYLTAEEKVKYAYQPGRAVKPIVLEPLTLSK